MSILFSIQSPSEGGCLIASVTVKSVSISASSLRWQSPSFRQRQQFREVALSKRQWVVSPCHARRHSELPRSITEGAPCRMVYLLVHLYNLRAP